jgi:hypothetical protein
MPGNEEPGGHWKTFSVGIFAWEKRARGRKLKRGNVKVRVRGRWDQAAEVYAKALEIICLLDEGKYEGPHVVAIKS